MNHCRLILTYAIVLGFATTTLNNEVNKSIKVQHKEDVLINAHFLLQNKIGLKNVFKKPYYMVLIWSLYSASQI